MKIVIFKKHFYQRLYVYVEKSIWKSGRDSLKNRSSFISGFFFLRKETKRKLYTFLTKLIF